MSELNTLLNDLNSLDYLQGKFVYKKTAARLIESFTNINTQEELMNNQKIQLAPDHFKKLIDWQLKCLIFNFSAMVFDILMSMHSLLRNNQNFGRQYWNVLLSPDGLFLSYLSSDSKQKI